MFGGAPDAGLVETGAPRVTLRNAFLHPFDSAIAAARTCYAPRLINPDAWPAYAQRFERAFGFAPQGAAPEGAAPEGARSLAGTAA